MLKEIFLAVKEQSGPLSLFDLSKELKISVPMLEQMLDTLVRNGKLQEVQPIPTEECTSCTACPILNKCDVSLIFHEKQYRITQ